MFLLKNKKRDPLCGVYSEKEFHSLLEHERRRVDRTKEKFSVAVFDVGDAETDIDRICQIPDDIIGSARSTDEVGWFDKHRIGVLLPDTPVQGAKHFVEYLSKNISSVLNPTAPKIYNYPSRYLGNNDQDLKENGISSLSPTSFETQGHINSNTHVPATSSAGTDLKYSALGLEPYLGLAIPGWMTPPANAA